MSRVLDITSLVDRGFWISDDRVYAFISASPSGITEVGYHGSQPVSRNSRIFVSASPAFHFSLHGEAGKEEAIQLDHVEWVPSALLFARNIDGGTLHGSVVASGRAILLGFEWSADRAAELDIRFDPRCLHTDVHGARVWEEPAAHRNQLYLRFRDRIMLHDWIRRHGAYAGDFLIPEHSRRILFHRAVRSGQATFDDLREEYRNADIPLYSSSVSILIGGRGFTLLEEKSGYRFRGRLDPGTRKKRLLAVVFDREENEESIGMRDGTGTYSLQSLATRMDFRRERHRYETIEKKAPKLSLPGFKEIETFFRGLPALVESCRVKEAGMTRANAGAYYWIWSWDSIVTALEFPRWRDLRAMRDTIRFVNAHRDVNGLIPGRWTRSYQPLDTPSRGNIEFLFTHLVSEYATQTGDETELVDVYPYCVSHLRELVAVSDDRGFFRNPGSYPDLPERFGRDESSVVAMEMAAFYSFSRLVANIALRMNDPHIHEIATEVSSRLEKHFFEAFYDLDRHWLLDGYSDSKGTRNESYPLFTLLFLQTPLGWGLIDEHVEILARFVADNHVAPWGIRLLPEWDKNRNSESVTDSWYPHWDIYVLKLMRRTGRKEIIMHWLRRVEETLGKLGYCPEFLSMEGFRTGHIDPWSFHGAASNLNCATGWYRSIIESVMGIESDPGGLTIIPAALPLPTIRLDGLVDRGTRWDIAIENDGDILSEVRVDGRILSGCLKIPRRYFDGRAHQLSIEYGLRMAAEILFTSIMNAEVLDIHMERRSVTLTLRGFGRVDIGFSAPDRPTLRVDGKEHSHRWDGERASGKARLSLHGAHKVSVAI